MTVSSSQFIPLMSESILPFIPVISSGNVKITASRTVTEGSDKYSFSASGYQSSNVVLVAAYGRSAYGSNYTTIMTLAYRDGKSYRSYFLASPMSSSSNVIEATFKTNGSISCTVSNMPVGFWFIIG